MINNMGRTKFSVFLKILLLQNFSKIQTLLLTYNNVRSVSKALQNKRFLGYQFCTKDGNHYKTLVVLIFFLLNACQATIGNKSTVNLYYEQINKGSALSEITTIYGDYSANWQGENGLNIYQYSYSKNKYDLFSQLPIINHFGWIKSENYEVLLITDKKGKIIKDIKFYNQAKSRNSLVCNPLIYSCLRKVY